MKALILAILFLAGPVFSAPRDDWDSNQAGHSARISGPREDRKLTIVKTPAVVIGELETPGFFQKPLVFSRAILLLKPNREFWVTDWNAQILKKGVLGTYGVLGGPEKLHVDGIFALIVTRVGEGKATNELVVNRLTEGGEIKELERHVLPYSGLLVPYFDGVYVISSSKESTYIRLPSVPVHPSVEQMRKGLEKP